MSLMDKILHALDLDGSAADHWAATGDEWKSGYSDGYADGRQGKDYSTPATNSEPARGGYAWGYSDGDTTRTDHSGPGWIW